MAIIFDLSSGTIESDASREGEIENRRGYPDERPELQLAMQEAITVKPRSHTDPALVGDLLKKL